MVDEIKTDKQSLRKFGLIMGFAFLLICALFIFKGKTGSFYPAVISTVFFLVSAIIPARLKSAYLIWMRLACVLSWINTRVILFLVFYLVISPIGVCLKLFSKDILDLKIDRKCRSYWMKKEPSAVAAGYERQF